MQDLKKIRRKPSLRVLLEEIIPQLGDMFHLEKEFTYKDIFTVYMKENLRKII